MTDTDWLHQVRPNRVIAKPNKLIRFRDINCDYGLGLNQQLIVEEDKAIRNQIKNLLSTPIGSEDFEPNYGSSLPLRLFEPINDFTAYLLETDTILALSRWMSDRIRLVMPGASIEPLIDDEGYLITLPYVMISTNTAATYRFEALR